MKKYRKRKELMPLGTAAFLLAVGILLGTVFTFGVQYWNETVDITEARHLTAIYDSYRAVRKERNLRDIKYLIVYFDGDLSFDIDSSCNPSRAADMLDSLSKGTEVELIVHPNADTIMDMRTDDTVILTFDKSQTALSHEKNGFLVLGIFMYASAAYAAYHLIRRGIRAQQRKRSKETHHG